MKKLLYQLRSLGFFRSLLYILFYPLRYTRGYHDWAREMRVKKRSNEEIYRLSSSFVTDQKTLTRKRKNEIKSYFKKFGITVNTRWHEILYSINGTDSNYYLSEYLFFWVIEPHFNDAKMLRAYGDKNLYSRIFPQIVQPKTVIRFISGAFYDDSYQPLERESAFEKIRDLNHSVIIKPSIGSGGGQNVNLLTVSGGEISLNDEIVSFQELLNMYKNGFIIQEKVEQHQNLNEIYPHSLNTIRLMTFRYQNETKVISALFRTGNNRSYIDNVAQSGLATGINPDGRLMDLAYDKNLREIREHPETNVPFGSVVIPNFNELLETVQKLHDANFYCNIASWDCAINKEGKPVLIEVNLKHQDLFFRQFIYGPLFGDQTDAILKEIFSKKN